MTQKLKSIVLVQHCQSEHHINGLTGGWTDTPLTELGRRQALATAQRLQWELAGLHGVIYTSDLIRASQTAAFIAELLGISAVATPELREINNGIAAGMAQEQASKIETTMPHERSSIDWQHFPQGETWRGFYERVASFMDRLAADEHKGTPILVTHGGAVINIIAWWLRLDVEMLAKISFGIAPGGITWLTTNSWDERTLKTLSDVSHLTVSNQ